MGNRDKDNPGGENTGLGLGRWDLGSRSRQRLHREVTQTLFRSSTAAKQLSIQLKAQYSSINNTVFLNIQNSVFLNIFLKTHS